MNKSKKKKNEWYYEWWIWAIVLFLFIFIKSKADNSISPFIFVIGLLCVGFSIWRLRLNQNNQSDGNKKTSVKTLTIIMIIGVILSILGYATLSIDRIQGKEKLLKVEFSGIDKNSSPLAASDLKLLKKEHTYTILGTLRKTSSIPSESYFDYDIILIDKYGQYIATKEIRTDTTTKSNNTLFTFKNEVHLEEDIYVFEKNKPVKVKFANIKEYSKDEFVDNTLKEAQQEAVIPSGNKYIIGSDKETVRGIFKDYKEKSSLMGENAIDFDSEDLLVTVFFKDGKADGVIFLSNNLDDMNTLTGEGSYVSEHYDELVKMATNDDTIKIETDLTKFNSQGNKKSVAELYIGNTPYNATTDTITQNTTQTKTKVDTSNDSEFESLVFLNVGVKVYRYKDENSYLGTIKMVDRDYKDESGKKVGAVYLEGGEIEGWYHRRDLVSNCYIRSDDPYKMGY